jgi:hypothetical protein
LPKKKSILQKIKEKNISSLAKKESPEEEKDSLQKIIDNLQTISLI